MGEEEKRDKVTHCEATVSRAKVTKWLCFIPLLLSTDFQVARVPKSG